MVKEYHDKCLHVIADCKTGNADVDSAFEHSIIGYVRLTVLAFETGQWDVLNNKMRDIAIEFQKQKSDK